MDCSLIEAAVELAHREASLKEKLAEFCSLILGHFPFDQCLVYMKTSGPAKAAPGYKLVASCGEGFSRVPSYAEGQGAQASARAAFGPAGYGVAFMRGAEDGTWRLDVEACGPSGACATVAEVVDPGLTGFSSAVVFPAGYGPDEGFVFLKSTADVGLDESEIKLLRVLTLHLDNIVRCASLQESHAEEHKRLEELEERLLTAEKFLGIGDMAAILAHEVKNPIISIGALAKKVGKYIGPEHPGARYLALIVEEGQRVEGIISGVIRFLRDNTVELAVDDANRLIEEVLHIFREDIAENRITVVREMHPEPLPVMADHEQIKIAFDNFISNAIQSMANSPSGDGGTLTVTTESNGNAVVIKVSDTGGGIDPGDIDHIFNPFFTTKERGTGLGLAITKSIIMRHRGVIEVNNKAGTGVTFAVRLPRAGTRHKS